MDLRALVVDDEQLARDELCFLLEQLGGVEVVGQAANGVEAIEALERLRPDIVFLDVQMPGLTGFEVARHVARRRPGDPRRLRHGVRPVRHRGVRGERGRLPAQAGRDSRGSSRRSSACAGGWTPAAPLNEHLEKIVRTGRRPAAAPGAGGRQGRRAVPAGPGRRCDLRVPGWGYDIHSDRTGGRNVQLPDAGRAAGAASTRTSSGGCTGRIWSTSTRSRR